MGRKNKVAFRKRLHRERSRRPKSRLKPTSAVFWLKRKYQTWERSEYADNLISYLNGASTCRTITLSELSNVLHGISGKSGKQSTCSGEHDNTLSIGEHVVAFWEEKDFQWSLGVVDHFGEKGFHLYLTWSMIVNGFFLKKQRF